MTKSAGQIYFVIIDDKQAGPYTPAQLRTKFTQGKIQESSYLWREGMPEWVPIETVAAEIFADGVLPSPPPIPDEAITHARSLTITHSDELPDTEIEIPERGPFEPNATSKQLNLLMKFGCKNPESIRHLGRDQASFMIDAFIKDRDAMIQYEQTKTDEKNQRSGAVAVLLILVVIGFVLLLSFLSGR